MRGLHLFTTLCLSVALAAMAAAQEGAGRPVRELGGRAAEQKGHDFTIPEKMPENPRERIAWVVKWLAQGRMSAVGLTELQTYLKAAQETAKTNHARLRINPETNPAALEYLKQQHDWHEALEKIVDSMLQHWRTINRYKYLKSGQYAAYVNKLEESLKEKALEFIRLWRQPPRAPRRQ